MSSKVELLSSGDWIPYRVDWNDKIPEFRWMFIGPKTFTEPFFEESLNACRSLPENREQPVCSGAELLEISERMTYREPGAIIFHVSRCGSTLVSQLLTTDDSNVVLSEVPLLDELLNYGRVGRADADRYFKAVVTILGRRKTERNKRTILKLDSWHLAHYGNVRKMYPDTLLVFLIREPDAIIRSHSRQPGIHSVMGTRISELLFSPAKLSSIKPAEYLSCVLIEYYRSISTISSDDNNCIVYDYRNGILPLVKLIYRKCNIPYTEQTWLLAEERLKFHSKRGQDIFTEGTTAMKHLHVTDEVVENYRQMFAVTEKCQHEQG